MRLKIYLLGLILLITTVLFPREFIPKEQGNEINKSIYHHDIDSLKMLLKQTDKKEEKIEILFKILESKYINNINSEEEIKQLEKELNNKVYTSQNARADYLIGNYLKINGAGNESMERYYRAYQYYTNTNNIKEKARLCLALAENLRAFAELDKALEFLYIAKSLWNDPDDRLTAEINDRFSAVFFESGLVPNGNPLRDSCLVYGERSLEYSIKHQDHSLILSTGNILGSLEKNKRNFKKSLEYFNLALRSAEISKRLADKALLYTNIARLYEKQNLHKKALETALIGYNLAKQTNVKIYILMSSQVVYEYYKELRDFEKALYYHEIYQEYRDIIYMEEKNRQINLTATKYELEKINKENELQKIKISKQNQRLVILWSTIIFAFILVFIFFYSLIKTKKLNIEIREEHRKVLQLEKIKSVYAMAITANHELNQPLTVMKGNIEMLEMSLENLTEKQKKYLNKINISYEKLLSILQKYRESNPMHFEIYAEDEVMVIFDDDQKGIEEQKNNE